MMRISTVVGLALTAILAGCSKPDKVTPASSSAANPAELTTALREAVLQRGRSLAGEAFSLLSSNLQSALASGGVTNALPYCSLAASPLTASLGDKHGVTIRRVTQRSRNPKGQANAVEASILEQYQGDLSQGRPLVPLVTNLQENSLTFFAPIVLTNSLCLKCHGEPGRDIPADHLQVIRRLYPQDQALGFRLGDLRGAWRIDFPAQALGRLAPPAAH